LGTIRPTSFIINPHKAPQSQKKRNIWADSLYGDMKYIVVYGCHACVTMIDLEKIKEIA
jgi:hypothetical protein